MNETQLCERVDAVAHPLDEDERGDGGSGRLTDPDHVFYLSAEQVPQPRAVMVRSREILGW